MERHSSRLRGLPRVTFQQLAEGVPLPPVPGPVKEKWSTREFYELEIKDTKLIDNVLYCEVHYIGWGNKYDELRPATELIDIPQEF